MLHLTKTHHNNYYYISVVWDRWTIQHRGFALKPIKKITSVIVARRLFRNNLDFRRHGAVLSRNTIFKWASNLIARGFVLMNERLGRSKSVRMEEQSATERECVLQRPKYSVALGVSRTSFNRILHLNSNVYSYKLAQNCKQGDPRSRLTFSQGLLQLIEDVNLLVRLIMSGEVHFQMCGSVNAHNCRYWAIENPNETFQKPLHTENVTFWCGVARYGIIRLYFIKY